MCRQQHIWAIGGWCLFLLFIVGVPPTAQAQWVEEAKLLASDGAADDLFAYSVSLSGDLALIGVPWDDDLGSNSGSAYVFERQGDGSWLEVAKLNASDGTAGEQVGQSVSVEGERALIGAVYDDDRGAAYVFERQGDGSWLEVAKLTASDGDTGDGFGGSVSLSGDRALVGASGNDDLGSNSGSAFLFERQGDGSWLEVAKLTASDGDADDHFGTVSLEGARALIGTESLNFSSQSGAAYVFERQEDSTWMEVAKLLPSDGAGGDQFGYRVSLSGDLALIGSPNHDDQGSNSGSVYAFERQGDGTWHEIAKLIASDGNAGDQFGIDVSSEGDRVLIGAVKDDDLGNDSGSAYVFERQGDDTWLEVAKLTSPDGDAGDWFGWMVSLSGDLALIGAHNNNSHGAAYVFSLEGSPCELIIKFQGTAVSPRGILPFNLHLRHNRLKTVERAFTLQIEDQSGAVRFQQETKPYTINYLDEIRRSWSLQLPDGLAPGHYELTVSIEGMQQGQAVARQSFKVAPGARRMATQEGTLAGAVTPEFLEGTWLEVGAPDVLPSEYALRQNYPNPFNPQTEISYALPEATHVQLVVFDVMGREVARLVDGVMPAGQHAVTFSATDLPSGLYLYQLETNSYTETRTMLLAK